MKVGGSALPGCTWAPIAHLVDGAGWRGRWTWPTSQGVRFSSFTLGLTTRITPQRGGMVTSRVSYARRSPVSTERCDWSRAGVPDALINHPRRGQHPRPQPSGPRSPTGRGSCPKPSVCTFESCRGYLAGDARVAEHPLRTRERESSTLSTGSRLSTAGSALSMVKRRTGQPEELTGARCERPGPIPGSNTQVRSARSGALFSCHCDHRDRKQTCRTRSTPT
jgi:hypothetical protein